MPCEAIVPDARSAIEFPTLTGGPSGKPVRVHHARLALDDEVVARPARLRPRLAEARDRAVHEPGIQRVHGLPAEPEPRERAGPEVLDAGRPRRRGASGAPSLPASALRSSVTLFFPRLTLMKYVDSPPAKAGQARAVVALARLLDLDHLGAHVGERIVGVGPGEHPGEVDHAHPVQRSHGVLRRSRLAALFANAENRPVAVSARRPPEAGAAPLGQAQGREVVDVVHGLDRRRASRGRRPFVPVPVAEEPRAARQLDERQVQR